MVTVSLEKNLRCFNESFSLFRKKEVVTVSLEENLQSFNELWSFFRKKKSSVSHETNLQWFKESTIQSARELPSCTILTVLFRRFILGTNNTMKT